MEIERPQSHLLTENILAAPKSPSFFRIAELFKALVTPRHEPIPLRSIPPGVATLTPRSSSTVHTPHLCNSQLTIEGHKGLAIADRCTYFPTMAVSPEYFNVWDLEIKDRLIDELAQCLRTVRCHPMFSMVRDKNGKIGPCILLLCWDEHTCMSDSGKEKTRRQVQKKVRKLQSMQTSRFACKVVIDSVSLLARFSDSIGPNIQACLDHTCTTYVGLLISDRSDPSRECTLGGLIRVGPKIYGLTVAHPFSRTLDQPPQVLSTSTASKNSSETESSDSDKSLFDGFEKISAADPHERSKERLARHDTILDSNDVIRRESQPSKILKAREYSEFGQILHSSKCSIDHQDLDWALVELETSLHLLSNSYTKPSSLFPTQLEVSKAGHLAQNSEIVVLGGKSGLQHGVVGQDRIDLRMKGRKLIVMQLILRQSLEHGDSGSWVLQDDKVVGCVVAGTKFLPTAYMIPIMPILEDIAKKVGDAKSEIASTDFISLQQNFRMSPSTQDDNSTITREPPEDKFKFTRRSQNLSLSRTPSWALPATSRTQARSSIKYLQEDDLGRYLPLSDAESQEEPLILPENAPYDTRFATLTTASSSAARRNFPQRQRRNVMITLALFNFTSSFASAMVAPVLNQIRQHFDTTRIERQLVFSIYMGGHLLGPIFLSHLSEYVGRKRTIQLSSGLFLLFNSICSFAPNKISLIVFRFQAGFWASTPITIGGSIMVELFESHDPGYAWILQSMALLTGLIAGPMFTATLIVSDDERQIWSHTVLVCFLGASVLVLITTLSAIFSLPRIYILRKVATKYPSTPRNSMWKATVRRTSSRFRRFFWSVTILFSLLYKEPIVLAVTIHSSMVFGTLMSLLGDIPMNSSHKGLTIASYGSIGLGSWVGALYHILRKHMDCCKPNHRDPRRQRHSVSILRTVTPALVLVPLGLTSYGVFVKYNRSWIFECLSLFLFGFGAAVVFFSWHTYLLETYGRFHNIAVEVVIIWGSVAGLLLPMIPMMTNNLRGGIFLGGILMVTGSATWALLLCFGEKLRMRSTLAAKARMDSRYGPGGEQSSALKLKKIRNPLEDVAQDEEDGDLWHHV